MEMCLANLIEPGDVVLVAISGCVILFQLQEATNNHLAIFQKEFMTCQRGN